MRCKWDYTDALPAGTRPSNPVICYLLWKARVPSNVPPGVNTIHVRVKDKLGRMFEERLKFEAV